MFYKYLHLYFKQLAEFVRIEPRMYTVYILFFHQK